MPTNTSHRAGRYISQPTGYRAFIPAPLPPTPPINLTGQLGRLLSEADRALGRLDGSITTLPNPDMFVFMYVRQEAVLSSQIEGTQSSLHDVLAAEARILNPEHPADVNEVLNYIRALNYGLSRVESLPVSVRLFREIHTQLMDGTRGSHLTPGELRRTQNWIGPPGCTLNTATFVPPPPHEVPQALSDLERFLHSTDQLPLLIRIGLAHAQFETMHPFLDGNGRLGRLLITLLLSQAGVLQKPVLYLSVYLKRHREQYYQRLQAVRDTGDWESWLTFYLQGIIDTSEQAARTARRITRLREDHRNLISENLGLSSSNGYRMIDYMYKHPVFAVKDVAQAIGSSYVTVNNLVARFVQMQLVEEVTGQSRNRRFRYEPYIRLFTGD